MRGDLQQGYRAERLRKLTDYGLVGILYSGQRVSVFTAMIEVGKKLNWGTENAGHWTLLTICNRQHVNVLIWQRTTLLSRALRL